MSRGRGSSIWLAEIVTALKQLRGEATLADIYAQIEKNYKGNKVPSWKSNVRQMLQLYDPKSKYYNGREPIFSHKGRGKWALHR